MAMRMPSDLGSSGLGSVQRRETRISEMNMFSQELENEKRSRLNSVKLVNKKDTN
jgi:DNA-binding TFAR19-related protein (PDSD5 family)